MFILKANAVQRSDHKEKVDDLLDRGFSLREIIRTLKHENKDFKDFSLTTLAKYAKQRREENQMRALGLIDDTGLDDNINYIRAFECNVRKQGYCVDDAQALDYIISQGLHDLVTGNRFGITKNDIFRAMERKAKILGPQYRGQTLWAQFEREDTYEAGFQKLWEIVHYLTPDAVYLKILEQSVKEGFVTQDYYDEYQEAISERMRPIQDDDACN